MSSSSLGLEPRTNFWGVVVFVPVILLATEYHGLYSDLLSRLVSKLHKLSSPGFKHRTGFQGSSLHFCNILFQTKNFVIDTVLFFTVWSYRKCPYWQSNSGSFFPKYSMWSLLCLCNKYAKFDTDWSICSWTISEQTNTYSFLCIFFFYHAPLRRNHVVYISDTCIFGTLPSLTFELEGSLFPPGVVNLRGIFFVRTVSV